MTRPGGLDRYLDKVLAALVAHGPYRNSKPHVGNIILACHSGGGHPMRELALAQNKCAQNIKECWGFDCTYYNADPTGWPKWARSRPDARLYLYYRPETKTAPRSKKIQALKLPNVFVATSSVGHNWVPIKHWRERVEQSPLLRPISGATLELESMNPYYWTPEGEASLEGEEDEYYAAQQALESESSGSVDHAVKKNRDLMKSVGWAPHANLIATKLLGMTSASDEAAFAGAVKDWQKRNCFSTADGIIGKQTWSEMAVILGLMRNDGKESGVSHYKTDPSYSQTLTQELPDSRESHLLTPNECAQIWRGDTEEIISGALAGLETTTASSGQTLGKASDDVLIS